MTSIYAASPQVPFILRFEDCSRAEVVAAIHEWSNGVTADIPDNNNILGFSSVAFKPLVDQGETDDFAYLINWGQLSFMSISEVDPNQARPRAARLGYLELCLDRQGDTRVVDRVAVTGRSDTWLTHGGTTTTDING